MALRTRDVSDAHPMPADSLNSTFSSILDGIRFCRFSVADLRELHPYRALQDHRDSSRNRRPHKA